MLTLRQDWCSVTGGAVAADLVAQVRGKKRRDWAAGCLIGASLDLMAGTWPSNGRPPLVVETLSNITWRVSRLYYAYLPADNDAALGRCIKLARHSVVVVIVPRCHRWLKERLLAAVLRRRDPGTVSLGNFISWRTISAAIDQRWPEERATLRLLAAYNRRVRAAGTGDLALLVDAPHEP